MAALRTLPTLYLSLYGRAILFVAGVCLALIGLDIGQSWTARDARLREAKTETENLARSLAQHAQDVFETTDALLKTLSEEISIAGSNSAAILRLDRQLHRRVSVEPLLHGVAVFDEHGDWIATSLAASDFDKVHALNYADRDFFRYHRDHVDDVALISPPIQSKLDGAWVVSMSRRLNHPDGSFAGASQAAISLDLFQHFFEPFAIGEAGAIILASNDGAIIVRRPFDGKNIGRSVALSPFFRKIRTQKETDSFAFTSLIDAVPRLGSFHRVAGFDLVVTVAFAEAEVLADWWHETKVHLVWLALTVLFVTVLGHRMAVQMRDRIAAEATAQRLRHEVAQLGISEAEHAAHDRALESANADLQHLSSDLADARDAADRANRAKSRFLAGMTHELRTPLNGILGYAHLLHMEGDLNATQDRRVNAMLETGKHLLELITCVLDLSEIETEHAELQPIAFDVQAVASACLELVRPTAEAKGLGLRMSVAPDTPPKVVADPTRLRQILVNLLGNAVKFTSQGSVKLQVLLSLSGSALRFEVTDTGPGVSADQRQNLFQDFERLDTESTRTVEGAGLGLAISNRLARLMGGSLGYDDDPGGGSVFWLELPLDTVSLSSPAMVPAVDFADTGPASVPVRPLHVLVVDDVLMNRDIASSFLRMFGHKVTCVEGGAEAVAAVAATAFDVVLMDVRMPEMDGLEATRRIRAQEGTDNRVPIIALTAQAFADQMAECRKAGMDSHLGKPFDPDTLLAVVEHAAGIGSNITRHPISISVANVVAAVPAVPTIGLDLVVWDLKAFQRTSGFLAPEAVTVYLHSIVENAEVLLQGLSEPDAQTRTDNVLAEAAHALAGSAGMFGFDRLANLGRRFERAVQSGAADAPALSESLSAAIEASLQSIRDHLSVPAEG
jgi:signal transduction histidine kinase/ActR/RegA family two-component response regulator/HPt (histidine-containing phosphotransfer) domain-containing protein